MKNIMRTTIKIIFLVFSDFSITKTLLFIILIKPIVSIIFLNMNGVAGDIVNEKFH